MPVDKLHRADGAAAMRRLLDAPEPPDAVFCFTDQLALGALRAAAERGLRVPARPRRRRVRRHRGRPVRRPALTTVSPDKAAIARVALDLLQAQLDGGSTPESVTAEHHLVVRETTDGQV